MKFLDEAKVYIKAGDGGDGCLSFRREKFIEYGGPDGGFGGTGGSVYVLAVKNINTLIDYRYQQHFKVRKAWNGEGQNKTGKSSEDIILKVPVGTQILDDDKITEIADLTEEGQIVLLAQGGKGGAGNAAFKNSTNQAPRKTMQGEPGEERWIWLKLKLIADIGLVGLPNAGKSTFISAVTNVKAKIENYPFSTLIPQLGMIQFSDKEVVIADIPGLIENAHMGKGLGDKFLAHVERCSVIIHIVDASRENPILDYQTIRNELRLYNHTLHKKPEIIALNKTDIVEDKAIQNIKNQLEIKTKNPVLTMSALTNEGCQKIVNYSTSFVNKKDEW